MTPREEYSRRRAAREVLAADRERVHVRLGNAKVAIFLAALFYGLYALDRGEASGLLVGIAAAVYAGLFWWHELTIRALDRARAAVAFYDGGIARIEDRWMGRGDDGARFRDSQHPYADDIDLFGAGSLFQLLCDARTPMGQECLAAWLKAPASRAQILERHARVDGLRQRTDLRERIATINAGTRRRMLPQRFIEWAEAPPSLPAYGRPLILLLALMFGGAVGVFMLGGGGRLVLLLLPVEIAVWAWLIRRAEAVVQSLAAVTEGAGLHLLAAVIKQIEAEPFEGQALASLASRLSGRNPADSASSAIAHLGKISDWADSRHNVFARLLDAPLQFTPQVAYATEAWRRRYGSRVRDWVDAVGEMEALLSLAAYSYEHPADPFPEIAEASSPFLELVDVTHPLIPAATAIRNSLALGQATRVLIVSGSNMSGKSTLLRTVGINVVLALTGAPVRASRLRLSTLVLGTCLRHTDSLHEHRSGFFTEALRIRLVFDLLNEPASPTSPPKLAERRWKRPREGGLFLFDELLGGTNSRDRRIAAEGLVRMMLQRDAIGMITTHDLALTEIAALFPGEVRNVHLQDHVEDGQMRFDYKLREGIITHSNALELMRLIGLDVS